MDSHVYAFCDSNPDKVGNIIGDKPVISYEESKELNIPYITTVSAKFEREISDILQADKMEYYTDIIRYLQIKMNMDSTDLNRKYCAFFHVDRMDDYFDRVEAKGNLNTFWGENTIFLSMFRKLELDHVVELACGRGRHVSQYADTAGDIVLVDILGKNIDFCKKRFKDRNNIRYYKNNGYDLAELEDGEYSALFTYDAMVHFEMFDVYNYLRETNRILRSGGKALFHHSNCMEGEGQSFDNAKNPGGRNFMSKELFAYLAYKAGFDVIEQHVIDWSVPKMDCVTLVQKP